MQVKLNFLEDLALVQTSADGGRLGAAGADFGVRSPRRSGAGGTIVPDHQGGAGTRPGLSIG
jgi:hypothetical protein